MSATIELNTQLQDLIRQINRAVESPTPAEIAQAVKAALAHSIGQGACLPEPFLKPAPDSYARRLLHKDPQNRYSMVVMVWRPGQGTPLHDHAGKWCVECVCQGNIRVKSYELKSQDGELCRFDLQEEVTAGLGEAGMLIPPFEHHILDNPFDQKAVTLHVYSQELTWCHAFVPAENGLHQQVRKTLGYTEH